MYNIELYNNIYKGEIQESIYQVTKLILDNKNERNIELIENTFIAICAYIGTFISLYDIRLWIDAVEEVNLFINDDKIIIKNIYILITKLCIVCDIYIKNPISKSGIISVTKLREKIIDLFDTSDKNNLQYIYINQFENVLPPINSESYNLAKIIISSIIKILKYADNIDIDSDSGKDELFNLSNKFKDMFDYISRKTYKFETKFQHSDNDSIWFLWGIIKIYDEIFGKIVYNLFIKNYSKKNKSDRLGLLWGASLCLIYLLKKDIARVWCKDEIILIKKVNEVSMDLYKEIKKQYNNINYIETNKTNETNNYNHNDGLNYLTNYVPEIKNNPVLEYNSNTTEKEINYNIKKIKY